MKQQLQLLLLLWGLGLVFGTLWLDWIVYPVGTEQLGLEQPIYYSGLEYLGEKLSALAFIFYPLAMFFVLIASSNSTSTKKASHLILKTLFYVNGTIVSLFLWKMTIGDYFGGRFHLGTAATGYWLWLIGNGLLMSWLWTRVYSAIVWPSQEDILDDLTIND